MNCCYDGSCSNCKAIREIKQLLNLPLTISEALRWLNFGGMKINVDHHVPDDSIYITSGLALANPRTVSIIKNTGG